MKQQINGNNPIRVLHMAPIRIGGITELVLTLSEKIDFEKVQFDYLTFEDTFDQASKGQKKHIVPFIEWIYKLPNAFSRFFRPETKKIRE